MAMFYNLILLTIIYQICPLQCDPTWETVRVTWGIPITKPGVFTPMPLKELSAIQEGFEHINDECDEHENFLGFRYWKNEDPSLILIYDNHGFIAGIQSAIPQDVLDNVKTIIRHDDGSAHRLDVIKGRKYYVQTAYFVEPGRICKNLRSQEEFDEEIGSNLYIQNGSNPLTDALLIPKFQSGISKTLWTKGGCFPTMGQHYWHDISVDKDCKFFYPVFLMYNRGKLTGFGFANTGFFDSPRYEHPTKPIIEKFIQPVPTCIGEELDSAGGYSTMHVFFNAREENLQC